MCRSVVPSFFFQRSAEQEMEILAYFRLNTMESIITHAPGQVPSPREIGGHGVPRDLIFWLTIQLIGVTAQQAVQ